MRDAFLITVPTVIAVFTAVALAVVAAPIIRVLPPGWPF